jgi:hypothetical protein
LYDSAPGIGVQSRLTGVVRAREHGAGGLHRAPRFARGVHHRDDVVVGARAMLPPVAGVQSLQRSVESSPVVVRFVSVAPAVSNCAFVVLMKSVVAL